jgi:hypothetical protein
MEKTNRPTRGRWAMRDAKKAPPPSQAVALTGSHIWQI